MTAAIHLAIGVLRGVRFGETDRCFYASWGLPAAIGRSQRPFTVAFDSPRRKPSPGRRGSDSANRGRKPLADSPGYRLFNPSSRVADGAGFGGEPESIAIDGNSDRTVRFTRRTGIGGRSQPDNSGNRSHDKGRPSIRRASFEMEIGQPLQAPLDRCGILDGSGNPRCCARLEPSVGNDVARILGHAEDFCRPWGGISARSRRNGRVVPGSSRRAFNVSLQAGFPGAITGRGLVSHRRRLESPPKTTRNTRLNVNQEVAP